MKNFIIFLLVCIIIVLVINYFHPLASLFDRTANIEDVTIEFWISGDGGYSYFQGHGYFRGWDTSVYMQLRIKIDTDNRRAIFPSVTFYIYDSENVDAYIIGGAVVNPRHLISRMAYDFTTRAVINNDNFTELIVEFIPRRKGTIRMYVKFDESVPDMFNRPHAISFFERGCDCAYCEPLNRTWNPSS